MSLLLASAAGCATTDIPNVRFYREVPFEVDPQYVYVESISGKKGVLSPEETEKLRPYMLQLDPEGVKAIRTSWYKICRTAGEQCNVVVKTIEDTLKKLDALVEKYFGVFEGGLK